MVVDELRDRFCVVYGILLFKFLIGEMRFKDWIGNCNINIMYDDLLIDSLFLFPEIFPFYSFLVKFIRSFSFLLQLFVLGRAHTQCAKTSVMIYAFWNYVTTLWLLGKC